MTTVPTKVSLIGSVVVITGLGALATLVHRPAATASSYQADTSSLADITPTVTSLGPPQISVNGQEISAQAGITTVPTPNGSATVMVSGNDTMVSSSGDVNQTTSTPSGDVSISIHSSSNGGNNASSHTSVSSHSFVSSHSSSDTSVSASGGGNVTVVTH